MPKHDQSTYHSTQAPLVRGVVEGFKLEHDQLWPSQPGNSLTRTRSWTLKPLASYQTNLKRQHILGPRPHSPAHVIASMPRISERSTSSSVLPETAQAAGFKFRQAANSPPTNHRPPWAILQHSLLLSSSASQLLLSIVPVYRYLPAQPHLSITCTFVSAWTRYKPSTYALHACSWIQPDQLDQHLNLHSSADFPQSYELLYTVICSNLWPLSSKTHRPARPEQHTTDLFRYSARAENTDTKPFHISSNALALWFTPPLDECLGRPVALRVSSDVSPFVRSISPYWTTGKEAKASCGASHSSVSWRSWRFAVRTRPSSHAMQNLHLISRIRDTSTQ